MTLNTLLLGEFERSLDEKHRVSLPKVFRHGLASKTIYLLDIGTILRIIPQQRLDSLKEIKKNSLLSHIITQQMDGANRFLVPESYAEFYRALEQSEKLLSKKNVILLGTGQEILVFPPAYYQIYQAMPQIEDAYKANIRQ